MRRSYRRYDPRLRNLVANAGDLQPFLKLGIPKSTLKEWIRNGPQEFFTIPELDLATETLIQENLDLKNSLLATQAKENLVLKTNSLFGFQVQYQRLPTADAKEKIIAVIKAAAAVIPLQVCLATIGLSVARFHHWVKRQIKCQLDDRSSCPRVSSEVP